MSWHCLQEQEAGFSVETYLAGIASARSKSSDTRARCCLPGSGTGFCPGSRFGTMCEVSTGSHGGDSLMWCQAGSRAKTYPVQEKEPGSRASEADCGRRCAESFARYDRDSRSWRTAQCLLAGGWEPYSGTWPKQGMMLRGCAYPLRIAARRTGGKGYGYLRKMEWPTPVKRDATKGYCQSEARRHSPCLAHMVQMFPTPQKADAKFAYQAKPEALEARVQKHQMNLAHAVQMFPTPTKQDAKNNGSKSQQERNTPPLNAVCGGSLNPPWVEWLMGWPIGWTDLQPLETGKFQLWRQQHSESFTKN